VPEVPQSLPGFAAWPTFPFEGDLRVKDLEDPVSVEPPRHGDNPSECGACGAPDEAYIWVSERWRVRSLDRPTGLPMVLILESRSHLDLGDLPNMLAAELGVMTVRLERAVRSLDGVARVHVNRWGDGSAHLHLWFLARPYGRLQLRGTFLSLWDEILPPIPEYQWRENLALVAAWLAEFGGRPLAEPPRIDWKSPATLTAASSSVSDGAGADGSPAGNGAAAAAPEKADAEGGSGHSVAPVGRAAEPIPDEGDTGTVAGDTTTGGNFPTAPVGAVATTGAETSRGSDGVPVPPVPHQSSDAGEIRVVPGPAGFPPIGDARTRGNDQTDAPVRSVPGQRDASADDRGSTAPTPA
jgi:hypothetical protein